MVKEQRKYPSLQHLFHQVCPTKAWKSAVSRYFLDDDLFIQKWVPDNVVSDAISQIVVRTKLRSDILTAHGSVPRHLDVPKTYFCTISSGPRLKNINSEYIKTCHVCQLKGKPNQTFSPPPLCPVSVAGQPFEHLLIDCVGPLPRSRTGNMYLLTVMY